MALLASGHRLSSFHLSKLFAGAASWSPTGKPGLDPPWPSASFNYTSESNPPRVEDLDNNSLILSFGLCTQSVTLVQASVLASSLRFTLGCRQSKPFIYLKRLLAIICAYLLSNHNIS